MKQRKSHGAPAHLMGQGEPLSASKRVGSAQAKSLSGRDTTVTLGTPPWEMGLRQGTLFEKETLPRKKPVWRMNVKDAGSLTGGVKGIRFECRRCAFDTGWIEDQQTVFENRRGMPCPVCNLEPQLDWVQMGIHDPDWYQAETGQGAFQLRMNWEEDEWLLVKDDKVLFQTKTKTPIEAQKRAEYWLN